MKPDITPEQIAAYEARAAAVEHVAEMFWIVADAIRALPLTAEEKT